MHHHKIMYIAKSEIQEKKLLTFKIPQSQLTDANKFITEMAQKHCIWMINMTCTQL